MPQDSRQMLLDKTHGVSSCISQSLPLSTSLSCTAGTPGKPVLSVIAPALFRGETQTPQTSRKEEREKDLQVHATGSQGSGDLKNRSKLPVTLKKKGEAMKKQNQLTDWRVRTEGWEAGNWKNE